MLSLTHSPLGRGHNNTGDLPALRLVHSTLTEPNCQRQVDKSTKITRGVNHTRQRHNLLRNDQPATLQRN